jgi:pimeloyl-ACP methyl ester carboxylesterase
MGMSLGGYTAALLATVSPVIDFVMPMVPLASISDFVRDHGQIGRGHEGALMYAGLERAYAGVSPLSRPLQLPPSRALVVAAEFDRITPRAHAERIAAHFGCAIVTIPGGHLIQLGRSGAFRELQRMLEREGIVEPRPERDRTR